MRTVFTILFFFFLGLVYNSAQIKLSRNVVLMGSQFNFTIVAEDSIKASFIIDSSIQEVERIENLISEWRDDTPIGQVNLHAGIKSVEVPKEVFEITKRAIEYSEMTNGAFDITTAAMGKIWKFDGTMTEMPSVEKVKESIKFVNFRNIKLDPKKTSIFLKTKGMKIGFGSIGKGYAADKARDLAISLGAISGIVNASGDIAVWGNDLNNKKWSIGVKNPTKSKFKKVLHLYNESVTTSGDYEKYAEIKGVRFSHIINPVTGYPSSNLSSVTIYGPSTEFANALSTSIMVLGKKKGRLLLKKFPNYQHIFIK